MNLGSVFYEVAALLALASAAGLVGVLLRQPLIVAFILVGLLAGPGALGITRSLEHIDLLAEIGVSVLLFLVGLKLDVQLVRTIGPVAAATGLGQIVFTAAIGFAICLALGFDAVASLYVAVALTFSSTIIVVKLLSDKREIDSLHGRIALGFLIVQDLAVVVAMIALSAFGVGAASGTLASAAQAIGGGIAMVAAAGLFIRYAAEPLLRRLAREPELLMTFAIGWAVLLASFGDWIGVGKEVGGLLGGVSLASTPYRDAIAARLGSLRDFLLLFFFIALGTHLELGILGAQIGPAIVLALFVLIGNPLIVLAIMGYMGYRRRTGFFAGLTVAQISEFSLIFMGMGVTLGHVGEDMLALVTMIGLVTIALSTYMIVYSHQLYRPLERLLAPFERRVPFRELQAAEIKHGRYDVILFGLGRYGMALAKGLMNRGLTVLGVDFDPEAVRNARKAGMATTYGDAEDPHFLESLPIRSAAWVVIGVPPLKPGPTGNDLRVVLTEALRREGFQGGIALTSNDPDEAAAFERRGATLVLTPFIDAAERAVEMITERVRDEKRPDERREAAGGER